MENKVVAKQGLDTSSHSAPAKSRRRWANIHDTSVLLFSIFLGIFLASSLSLYSHLKNLDIVSSTVHYICIIDRVS
jgi:hypothetical protein